MFCTQNEVGIWNEKFTDRTQSRERMLQKLDNCQSTYVEESFL